MQDARNLPEKCCSEFKKMQSQLNGKLPVVNEQFTWNVTQDRKMG